MCIGDQQYITLLFYLDDICVFSETADQMLDRIELVFSRLKEFNLKIKPKKSYFFQAKVTFLGHELSGKGVSPNPEKVDKIKDWPVPTNSKEVHSFVGLASYYRRFIPNFAKWAGPLHALIIPASIQQKYRKGLIKKTELPEFKWTEECQQGFDNLKQALTSAPVLAYPNYSRPFILETDASLKGLGAILSQRGDDGTVRVIAYASRSLRPGEKSMRDYSSAKIELLALKWAVCEKFKDYLLGSKFTVYTDNNPLVYVKMSKLGAAQIRWLSELALYNFDIVYRTGKSNLVADALSRRPESPSPQDQTRDSDEEWEAVSYPVTSSGVVNENWYTIPSQVISNEITKWVGGTKIDDSLRERIELIGASHQEGMGIEPIKVETNSINIFSQIPPDKMAEAQQQDNQLGPILSWVQEGKYPPKSILYKIRSKMCRKLIYQFDRLVLKKGVLHRLYIDQDIEYHQLVLPQKYHSKVLRSVHDEMGHQGFERTLELLRERVYWPSMTADTSSWVTRCNRCQVAQGNYTKPKPKIGNIESHNPLDLLCLDFTKIDKSRTGKENVLVMTDALSKFSVAVVTPNQKATTVAKALVDKWFYTYGIPTRIHSDQGKSFDND
ncbi:MAG: DDE-type integrase/transposase/recombinase, partial [Proteobacteria bacterium]|nr:DDE-type integrase/transposase/recombinase [Pseudomonadota bacterium]